MNKVNYQLKLDGILESIKGTKPKLLLHVCCAPCSSYVLSYLRDYFDITVLYYNPNISPYEGGFRCLKCYYLRLEKTASLALLDNFDYFTTTLSISPLKDAQKLNEIGEYLEKKYKVKYLYSDFKKRDGYKKSIILSKKYNLYRQNYCGCIYSKPKIME